MHITRNNQKYLFFSINVLGGIAVLSSYAFGLITEVEIRDNLWGNIPEIVRPYYTLCMVLAAIGNFFFTNYILQNIILNDESRFNLLITINLLYAGFILPSALWMPMTFSVIESPSLFLWIVIRLILLIVGFSSTGLLIVMISIITSFTNLILPELEVISPL